MNEPELVSGDSGEWVVQLQTRLNALGKYAGSFDGHYGEQTEAAVLELQTERALTADGKVDAHTWAALGEAEEAAGLNVRPPAIGDESTLVQGTLSEDQQWLWDGDRWQPAASQPMVAMAPEEAAGGGHRSADGQWLWDGSGWQPVDQPDMRG